ncbi:MAG: methyltransferase [Candidatus Aenigmarchaeota archaeon ex4484_224]|nr:MAG: methyltransferase [Candidatus Aenigmarchaeota archaeon ex4484_224]
MGKKLKEKLKNLLKEKIPNELLEFLPSHYFIVGDILIFHLDQKLEKYEKEIGEAFLKLFPYVKVVVRKIGPFKGITKEPSIKVVAGENRTETIHKENKVLFKLDVSKIEFAKGNVVERKRLIKLVGKNEVIVDMFAGIGYFSLPIAVYVKPKKIYAIDINPIAIHYLKENIRLNKVSEIVVPILGDCREISEKLKGISDRVIMGYIPFTREFLPYALKFLKEKGIIHFHDTFHEREIWDFAENLVKEKIEENGYKLEKILEKRIVKQYAPRIWHVAMDLKVKKKI